MAQEDRIDFARQSLAANRRVVERSLAELRNYTRYMMYFRHGKTTAGILSYTLMKLQYWWEKRKLLQELRETRWKVHFYRKVEADLEHGDLGSAIEALSLFVPREETASETIRHVRNNPATVWAVQRSPHILRINMLSLRDDLIEVQSKREHPC